MSSAVIKTQEVAPLLLRSMFSQIRRKKIHLEFEASGKTSQHKSPLPPRLFCLTQETAASPIDSRWIRIKQVQSQKFKYEILEECWGDSAPSRIKEHAEGGKGSEKEPQEMRDQRERTTERVFIFHLVPVLLLFNNFPYGRFTLTEKRKTFPVYIYSASFAFRRLDFGAGARPLARHGHIPFLAR